MTNTQTFCEAVVWDGGEYVPCGEPARISGRCEEHAERVSSVRATHWVPAGDDEPYPRLRGKSS